MTQTMFVERRSATWERLDGLLVRAGRRGVRALQPAEIAELGRLYRATTSDLAYAKGSAFDRVLLEYLNRLTARAHAYVYGATLESGYCARRTILRRNASARVPAFDRLYGDLHRIDRRVRGRRVRADPYPSGRCVRAAVQRYDPGRNQEELARLELRVRSKLLAGDGDADHHQQHQGRDHRIRRLYHARVSDVCKSSSKTA